MIEDTLCPTCGGRMVSRQNKTTGQRFWGCAKFPACKGTRDVDGRSPEDRRREASRDEAGEPDTRLPSERRTDRGWGR